MYITRSIFNKIDNIYGLLEGKLYSNNLFDVIAISETWLTNSFPDSLLTNGLHYNVYRQDRATRDGGVCLFVTNYFPCFRVSVANNYFHVKVFAVDLSFLSDNLRIIVCYNPPPHSDINYVHDLCLCLDELLHVNYSAIILGDFNFPLISWDKVVLAPESREYAFYECCMNNGLSQLINQPTYINSSNILDLLLTNDPESIYDVSVSEPFSTSDYAITIMYEMHFQTSRTNRLSKSVDYKNSKYDVLNQYPLAVDWNEFFYCTVVSMSSGRLLLVCCVLLSTSIFLCIRPKSL